MTDSRVNEVIAQLQQGKRVVPVITLPDVESALPMATALDQGGLSVLEITLRTPAGLGAIATLRQQRPDLLVGAGTVRSLVELEQAIAAGAQFIVSPGMSTEMVKAADKLQVPIIPGVMTPSEIMQARTLGLSLIKLFPATQAGGVSFLQAMAAVFPDMVFFPTGGVRPETAPEFLSLPNVICVGGTWLTPATAVKNGDWAELTRLAAAIG